MSGRAAAERMTAVRTAAGKRVQTRWPRGRRHAAERPQPPAPRLYARLALSKGPEVAWLGHLELLRAVERAARRAGLPVPYSQGFNPRPKISFASALPLGATGSAELVAIDLARRLTPVEVAKALNQQLPRGLEVREARVLPRSKETPFADITKAQYQVTVSGPEGMQRRDLEEAIERLLAQERLEIRRETKGGERTVDLRPLIYGFTASEDSPPNFRLSLLLAAQAERQAKPREVVAVLAALVEGLEVRQVHRERLIAQEE